MNTRLAEDQIFIKRKTPLIYLVENNNNTGKQKIIQSRSGLFYVLVVVVIFFSLGLMLNIALKVQSLNIGRKIIEINEMLLIEEERADRIKLKITELKSPERILNVATNDLKMEISNNVNFVYITANDYIQSIETAKSDHKRTAEISYGTDYDTNYIINNDNSNDANQILDIKKMNKGNDLYFNSPKNNDKYNSNNSSMKGAELYNNFIGTISNIKDIVMVVSEGVLTFFIP